MITSSIGAPLCDQADHSRSGDPRAANTRNTTHDLVVRDDPIVLSHSVSVSRVRGNRDDLSAALRQYRVGILLGRRAYSADRFTRWCGRALTASHLSSVTMTMSSIRAPQRPEKYTPGSMLNAIRAAE